MKSNDERNQDADQYVGKNVGQQGVDKAPGEEPSETTENVIWETQKGKNKVDGDPSKESDRPVDQKQK